MQYLPDLLRGSAPIISIAIQMGLTLWVRKSMDLTTRKLLTFHPGLTCNIMVEGGPIKSL